MGWIVGLVCCQQPLLGSLVDLLANLLGERAHPGQNKQTVSLSPHALAQPYTYLMAAPDRAFACVRDFFVASAPRLCIFYIELLQGLEDFITTCGFSNATLLRTVAALLSTHAGYY